MTNATEMEREFCRGKMDAASGDVSVPVPRDLLAKLVTDSRLLAEVEDVVGKDQDELDPHIYNLTLNAYEIGLHDVLDGLTRACDGETGDCNGTDYT